MAKMLECGIFEFGREVAALQARTARARVNQPFVHEKNCQACGGNCKATVSPGNHIKMDEAESCLFKKPPFRCGARSLYEAYRLNDDLHALFPRIPIMDNTRGTILNTCWRCKGNCGFENRTGTDLKFLVPSPCQDKQIRKRAENFNNPKTKKKRPTWKRH